MMLNGCGLRAMWWSDSCRCAQPKTLVRKTLEGKGRAHCATPPDLSVVSEVLSTPEVRLQLPQRSAGASKLIVEFADPDSRDASIAAIKTRSRPRTSGARNTDPAFSPAEYT